MRQFRSPAKPQSSEEGCVGDPSNGSRVHGEGERDGQQQRGQELGSAAERASAGVSSREGEHWVIGVAVFTLFPQSS